MTRDEAIAMLNEIRRELKIARESAVWGIQLLQMGLDPALDTASIDSAERKILEYGDEIDAALGYERSVRR